jgi:hypothetical protein
MHELSLPTLAKREQNLFHKLDARITENLEIIAKAGPAYVQLVKDLATVHGKKLYYAGGYATWEDYCRKKLGRSRQYMYGILRSYDQLQRLLAGGVTEEELPATERLNRAIHDAISDLPADKQDDALVPIWKATMRVARDKGRRPTVIDVQEAAVEIINSDKTIERQQKEVLSKIEGAGRALKIGFDFDALTPDFRRRLQVALMAIADHITTVLSALNSQAVTERAGANNEQATAVRDEASEKARIIKENIAEHHGEKITKEKARSSKR